MRLLHDMEVIDGLAPSHLCYNAAIDACAKVSNTPIPLSIYKMSDAVVE